MAAERRWKNKTKIVMIIIFNVRPYNISAWVIKSNIKLKFNFLM